MTLRESSLSPRQGPVLEAARYLIPMKEQAPEEPLQPSSGLPPQGVLGWMRLKLKLSLLPTFPDKPFSSAQSPLALFMHPPSGCPDHSFDSILTSPLTRLGHVLLFPWAVGFFLASPLDVFQLSLHGQCLSDLPVCSYGLWRFLHHAFQLKPARVHCLSIYLMFWHRFPSVFPPICTSLFVAVPILPASLTFWTGVPTWTLGFFRSPPICCKQGH